MRTTINIRVIDEEFKIQSSFNVSFKNETEEQIDECIQNVLEHLLENGGVLKTEVVTYDIRINGVALQKG